jgi:hypothetical protein
MIHADAGQCSVALQQNITANFQEWTVICLKGFTARNIAPVVEQDIVSTAQG